MDSFQVTTYYSRDQRIHCAIERPDLPGLLKLVTKQSELVSPRRKANGHKSTDEVFSWACGLCFFERRKKSTIKDHVIHRVCQKPIENKKSGKLGRRQLQRHFSCDFEKERNGIWIVFNHNYATLRGTLLSFTWQFHMTFLAIHPSIHKPWNIQMSLKTLTAKTSSGL